MRNSENRGNLCGSQLIAINKITLIFFLNLQLFHAICLINRKHYSEIN